MSRHAPAFWRRRSAAACALWPIAALFAGGVALRRALYRLGLCSAVRLPVPVAVVGNVAVGGSGKTPVVEWLVGRLRDAGFTPGIVSRGYGGRVRGVALVPPDGDPGLFGDEPVLLARLTGCPVAVGANRPAAARALLSTHPGCDVIVSDDGLQHYRLGRDVEIAVVDEATLGNRWPLPAGPLREGLGRLREVDLVIAHGALSASLARRLQGVAISDMALEGDRLRAVREPARSIPLAALRGRRVHAVAGIGRPERFFAQLEAAGLDVVRHPLPDHHRFAPGDLDFPGGGPVVVTAKDAVKCAAIAPADTWVFPVEARIAPGAAERILERLTHGRPVA